MPAPVSPYQPAAGFQQSALAYSFHRWLMLGLILVLASVIFVEVVAMDGAPSAVDYDLEAEGAMQQMQEDTETHTDLNRVIGSVGGILQALGLGLICYALLRESHDEKEEHTAMRVTAIIVGVLVLMNIASRSITIF
tara:strand:- start:896 stop:1306 length:411 start_codon:yes stop_codon:yes gene_type:complete